MQLAINLAAVSDQGTPRRPELLAAAY